MDWIEELKLKLAPQGDLVVNKVGETSCPGVFAAGDVSNVIKAVAPAMAAGAMNGTGIAHPLVEEEAGLGISLLTWF